MKDIDCNRPSHPPAAARAAVKVLRCADCGKVFARCAVCLDAAPTGAAVSMKAHRGTCHVRYSARLRAALDDEGALDPLRRAEGVGIIAGGAVPGSRVAPLT